VDDQTLPEADKKRQPTRTTTEGTLRRNTWLSQWPWLLLAVMTLPAIWHVVHFPDDIDLEFPSVVRPTFSPLPPPAYRLAEPGDTIDRIAIYLSSLALVLSLGGLVAARHARRLWLASLVLSAASFWYAANPLPTHDGWHGLGWGAIADPAAPFLIRSVLALLGLAFAGSILVCVPPSSWARTWSTARDQRVAGLAVVATVLTALRVAGIPHIEPIGYWPRWEFVWGLVAFAALLLRTFPRANLNRRRLVLRFTSGALVWYGLVAGGIWLTWYHRPLERLRAVVPGKIYISAMPSYNGLVLAQERHRFKTIINLFPEDTPQRSPKLPQELRFVKERGLRYVASPSDVEASNDFLDLTLKLARDPDAWPILVHCHGCMDRTPAWVGIYRFVVEETPLEEVLRFIEQHRGYRPKASVTLLYNRVLPRVAPEHCRTDPTIGVLSRCAGGTVDPYDLQLRTELGHHGDADFAAPGGTNRLSARHEEADGLAPNLTPRR
jgi:hypothetical protein